MRILAGKYKNRKLKSVPGQNVRPTPSSVKKSIFQIIEPFEDKKILDLFAGIGSLGIESLSRGSVKATFVEKDRKVIDYLSHNLRNLCEKNQYTIVNLSVEKYFKKCSERYDIIFADPPYGTISFEELKVKVSKLLNYNGIFCMERRFEKTDYDDVRIKNYGKTQILIWKKIKK